MVAAQVPRQGPSTMDRELQTLRPLRHTAFPNPRCGCSDRACQDRSDRRCVW